MWCGGSCRDQVSTQQGQRDCGGPCWPYGQAEGSTPGYSIRDIQRAFEAATIRCLEAGRGRMC